jgi:DNA polymerase-3 subunit gamma/tau
VVYQRALSLLGATDVALIDDAVEALAAGDAAALFGAVESVIDAGHDPRRFAVDLLERFRDLIVLQAVPDAAARGVVDAPEDELEKMRSQADRMGTATLTRYAEVVHAGLGEMRGATAPRLLLEVVCARLLLPSASDTESALLQRVERIETRLEMSIPASEASAGQAAGSPGRQFVRKSVEPKQAAPAPTVPSPVTPAPVAAVAATPTPAAPTPAASTPAAPTPVAPAPSAPPAAPQVVQEPEPQPAKPAWRPPAPAEPAPVAARPRVESPPSPRPEPTPAPPPPAPEPAPAPTAGEPDAAAVRSMWTTVREKVRQRSRTTEVMLTGATVRAIDGDTLVLSHESAPLAKRLCEQRNTDVIREALKDALGVNWRVRCEAGGEPVAPAGRPAEPPPDPAERQAEVRAEEDAMLAEAADTVSSPRRDPEEVALELLQSELGARKIQS